MTLDAREKSTFGGAPYECYWFTCGAQNWYYTSGDTERIVNGHTYAPEAITRTEISQSQEINSGEITVTLPLDNAVAALFKGYLTPVPVFLTIYRGHDGEPEIAAAFLGKVSSCPFQDTAKLKVVPDQDALKRDVPGLTYQSQCPRRLFSLGCGVAQVDYMTIAVLTYVSGVTLRAAVFATKVNGYFKGGWVDHGGGVRQIKAHTGDTLTLMDPFPADLVPGTQVLAYPGCQGTEAYCATVFNNLVNHLGFSHIPGVNPFGGNGVG
jgi:uncharacterized phage protein (TIGR02218 family)